MLSILLRHLLWIAVPVALAFTGNERMLRKHAEGEALASAERLGTLVTHLFRDEMARKAARLAGRAPVLERPDSASPLIRAALTDDTVAALSSASGELLLSVALRERSDDGASQAPRQGTPLPGRLRGLTEVFTPASLALFRSRTGSAVALYLRGERILSRPESFGPAALPDSVTVPGGTSGRTLSSQGEPAIVLPVDPTRTTTSAVHFLVTPSPGTPTVAATLSRAVTIGLGLLFSFGLAALGMGRLLKKSRVPPRILVLAVVAVPLLCLWLTSLVGQRCMEAAVEESRRSELVRALALVEGVDGTPPDKEAVAGTPFGMTRLTKRGVRDSTLPTGPLLDRVAILQSPPPGFPGTGTITTEEGAVTYAAVVEESGDILVLTIPPGKEPLRRTRLLLAALAGAASLLTLGFLVPGKASPPGMDASR